MPAKAVALDPGSFTWKILQCRDGRGGLAVTRFAAIRQKDAAAALRAQGISLKGLAVGLAGRDMTLRYTQVPPSPDWQLRSLMDLEIQDIASQSGGGLSADYNLLPKGEDGAEMDTVLMALARNDALDRVAAEVSAAGGSIAGHIPNCVALYNAYLRTAPIEDEAEVVCLANIGSETTDIVLMRGQDLLFARNLSSGSKVLDDAIAGAFGVSERKAESLKRELVDLDPESRGRYASGQAEKITMAAGGAASAIVSGIQSSVAFCQSQTKVQGLQLDRVLISGGGARLRGLPGMLREALRCPVELFDPFASVDLSALPSADAEQLASMRSEAVVALGLAASRLGQGVYELEILPEAVKRRQRFLQRTIFNIAAAVIAVALLVFGAVQAKNTQAAVETDLARINAQKKRVKNTHADAEELIAKNATLRQQAQSLTERAVPLHGVLRTMRALHTGGLVPPELWITSLEVQKGKAASGSHAAPPPVVVLKGSVRPISGRDVGEVYQGFLKQFREHELIAGNKVEPRVDDPSDEKTSFTFTIGFAQDEPPVAAAEAKEN
jgi:type IV pilus assembly protein PilM